MEVWRKVHRGLDHVLDCTIWKHTLVGGLGLTSVEKWRLKFDGGKPLAVLLHQFLTLMRIAHCQHWLLLFLFLYVTLQFKTDLTDANSNPYRSITQFLAYSSVFNCLHYIAAFVDGTKHYEFVAKNSPGQSSM